MGVMDPLSMTDDTRSAAGGWSSEGPPEHGDFVRPRPTGNAHIVQTVTAVPGFWWVTVACGKAWADYRLTPAPEEPPRPCAACWEEF